MVHELIIIGSGPAGYTAAIYAARADLKPLMFCGLEPGGQLMTTTEVDNFPGFPQGLMGPDMMMLFREQAARFGTDMRDDVIARADLSQSPYRLWTEGGEEFAAHALIVTTGASAKWLGLPSETRYRGHGVSACATCDGFFFRNKVVAVVGGGDTAMEETNFLTKFASRVHLVHRRDTFRASKIMQKVALENPKVEVHTHSAVVEVHGTEGDAPKVTGVTLEDVRDGSKRLLPVDGLFLAIGHQPNSAFLGGQLRTDPVGYIEVTPGRTMTSVPGVFAAGDVMDPTYRQAVSAAGSGCMAALDAERYLSARERTTVDSSDEPTVLPE